MVLGIMGCILPILPGPPASYIGLLLLQISSKHPFTVMFLVIFGLLTILVLVLDFVIPVYGTKRFQGSKYGIWGSAAGLIIGFVFLFPVGIIIGPLSGAFIGEILSGKNIRVAIVPTLGSFVGFLAGTAIKLILTIIMAYHFVINVI